MLVKPEFPTKGTGNEPATLSVMKISIKRAFSPRKMCDNNNMSLCSVQLIKNIHVVV